MLFVPHCEYNGLQIDDIEKIERGKKMKRKKLSYYNLSLAFMSYICTPIMYTMVVLPPMKILYTFMISEI